MTDKESDIYSTGYWNGIAKVKLRELTNEEIWAIASEIEPIDLAYGVRLSNELNVLDFARAILRKAQDK